MEKEKRDRVLSEVKFKLLKKWTATGLDDELINDCVDATLEALSIADVVGRSEQFVCDKHPNARTYTSTTGKQCCVKCVMG